MLGLSARRCRRRWPFRNGNGDLFVTDAAQRMSTSVESDARQSWAAGIPVTSPGAYARDAGVEGSHLYAAKWHSKLGPIFR